MDGIELLESVNPIPEHRGNPGPPPTGPKRRPRTLVSLAGVVAIAAAVIVIGAIFVRQRTGGRSDPIDVDTAAEAAASTTVEPNQAVQAQPTVVEEDAPAEIAPSERAAVETEQSANVVTARLLVPAIDLDQLVVEGVDAEALRKGPGHYPATPLPGQAGNAAIAGHRTTYGAPFHRLDELDPGDQILVRTLQGLSEYAVRRIEIVDPDRVDVLDDFGDNRLTLTARHPKYSARQRIVVVAELLGDPVPTVSFAALPVAGDVEQTLVNEPPDLSASTFRDLNQPYFAFTGTTDPIETSQQFLTSQFPDWNPVSLVLYEQTERAASIRWDDNGHESAGWIVLFFGDGRFWVWEMTTDGLTVDIGPTADGGSGLVKSARAVDVEVLQAIEADQIERPPLQTIRITPDQIGLAQPVEVTAPGGRLQEVRVVQRDQQGQQVGGAIVTFESIFRTPQVHILAPIEQTDAVVELLRSEPTIVADFVTYDVWQSADLLARLDPERAVVDVALVPSGELTSVLLHIASDEAARRAETSFFEAVAADFEVLSVDPDGPNRGSLGPVELGPPVDRYVVDRLPAAAKCAMPGILGSATTTAHPTDNAVFATARQLADGAEWQIGSHVVEFVDRDGLMLGFGSVNPESPRTFLSMLAVAQAAEGWTVDYVESIGC